MPYFPTTSAMIVAALSTLKEFHIDLIDLSWKFLKEDGTLDEEKVALNRKEVDEATDQAATYVKGVKEVTVRIQRFKEKAYLKREV
jgi:hypothetical protein